MMNFLTNGKFKEKTIFKIVVYFRIVVFLEL